MDFDCGTVERNMIDLNVDDVVSLQCDEHMIEDALLGPAVGACINRMPIAEFFR